MDINNIRCDTCLYLVGDWSKYIFLQMIIHQKKCILQMHIFYPTYIYLNVHSGRHLIPTVL